MGGIVGFSFLTLISYILIVLNIPVLIIPVVVICIFFVTKPFIETVRESKFKLNLQTILILIVFTLGIAGQMAIISPSGSFKNGDLLFWSAHGHDGAWHIALMEEIKKGWPFQNPSFAGEKLVNYHFFGDILPAMASKYLPISNLNLYFRIFPLLYSIFLGASAYFLTKKLTNSFSASIWATIFTYFAGSFGFIVTYLKNKTIGGESIFWATQPQSASGNPPQIISDFLILTAIYFLIVLTQQKNKYKSNMVFVICIILFGTLASFKVYAGVVALGALGITAVWQIVKEKRFQLLTLTIISGLLTAILYLPNTSKSASFLIFQPWWYIRTMVVEPSRLNWLDLELRRQFYLARGGIKSILRILEYEGAAFVIFFLGNLGMRFFGLFSYLKTHLIIKTAIAVSLIFPLLFLQKGVASNTSQFLQYFVLLFGILAGIEVSKVTNKVAILIPFIIILMLPTQIGLLNEFYSRPAFAKISSQEIEATNYIRDNTPRDTIVMTPPYNQYLDLKSSTPNIWDWFDTSYVPALTERRTYFDDYEQMDIMNYDWKPRLETKNVIFNSINITEVKKAFSKSRANILYFPKVLKPKVNPENIDLTQIFENEEIEVWKTN
jgi:hypothetical protein